MSEPRYQRGHVSLNLETLYLILGDKPTEALQDCVFGVEVNEDGRVWVCVNGATWLRFKPNGRALAQ